MRDLNEVLDLTLRLPIGGRTYVVHPPSAAVVADLNNRLVLGIAVDAGVEVSDAERAAVLVTDEQVPDFGRAVLGDTLDQLVADGYEGQRLDFVVATAFLAWTVGREYAEHYWETGGEAGKARPRTSTTDGEGPLPTATRTRSAAASTTPRRASASGTRTTSRKRKVSPSRDSGGAAT